MSGKKSRKQKQAHDSVAGSKKKAGRTPETKLHGVITEAMVPDQVKRSGLYPFTFSSALVLMAAALVGGVIIPWQVERFGIAVELSMTVVLPPLLAAGLAISRYFIDSKRGVCRGFWITFCVTWAVSVIILYLLFFQGIALT